MAVIHAQKIPKSTKYISTEDLLALFCCHFQQYTFAQARKLPEKRILQMLKVAEREYAKKMYDFTQIISSPYTKKLKGITNLLDYYKGIIDN